MFLKFGSVGKTLRGKLKESHYFIVLTSVSNQDSWWFSSMFDTRASDLWSHGSLSFFMCVAVFQFQQTVSDLIEVNVKNHFWQNFKAFESDGHTNRKRNLTKTGRQKQRNMSRLMRCLRSSVNSRLGVFLFGPYRRHVAWPTLLVTPSFFCNSVITCIWKNLAPASAYLDKTKSKYLLSNCGRTYTQTQTLTRKIRGSFAGLQKVESKSTCSSWLSVCR